MSRTCIVFLLFTLFATPSWAQKDFQAKYKSAESYIESGFYELARNLLSNVQAQTERGSEDYRYCADQIAHTYTLQWDEVQKFPLASKRLTYLTSFLTHIEKEGEFLGKSLNTSRKYRIYESLVGEYLNIQKSDLAKKYQDSLYAAHKEDLLPNNMKDFYSLGTFSNGSVSIWGYEWFEGVSAEKDHGSSSKLVFSVYPASSAGMDETELMQFHLKKIAWIDPNLGEFILVQRPGVDQEGTVTTLWDFSFDSPLDYLEVREIIMMLAMSGDSRG